MKPPIRSVAARTGKRPRQESPGKNPSKKFRKDDSKSAARGAPGAASSGIVLAPRAEGTRLETIRHDRLFGERRGNGTLEPELSEETRTDRRALVSDGREAETGAFSASTARDELRQARDRKSTRLNSSHGYISYAVFCLKKKSSKQ